MEKEQEIGMLVKMETGTVQLCSSGPSMCSAPPSCRALDMSLNLSKP